MIQTYINPGRVFGFVLRVKTKYTLWCLCHEVLMYSRVYQGTQLRECEENVISTDSTRDFLLYAKSFRVGE